MKKIAEIRAEFETASMEEQRRLREVYREDDRSGVRKLIEKKQKSRGSSPDRKTPNGTYDGV